MNQDEFFDLLYGGVEGEVRISLKGISEGRWFTWPEQRDALLEYVREHSDTDVYCTTTTYTERTRKAEKAKAGVVVYADADTCEPKNFRLEPTIIVQSSPGHWQTYWLLTEPTDAATLADASKRIAYAHAEQGCDKTGWMLTKVLRVPGTMHTKTADHFEVTGRMTGVVYELTEITNEYTEVALSDTFVSAEVPGNLPDLFELQGRLPMDLWNLYSERPEPGIELSGRLWKLELELFRAGWTAEEVFVLVQSSGSNKYSPSRYGETTSSGSVRAQRSNPDADLWKEVQQAAVAAKSPAVAVEVEHLPYEEQEISFLTQAERDFVASHTHFVDRFVRWVRTRTDGSDEYSRLLGFLLLSCVFGDRYYIPSSWGNSKLNLWGLMLGETTITRKSTIKSLFLNVLHHYEKETETKIDVGSDFSAEGLNKVLGDRDGQASLVWRDEVQGFFKEMFTKNYMAGTVERLTDLYEGRVQVSMRATKGTSQNNRASVLFNMLLLGIEAETAEVLTNKNFQSGFLTRFIWTIAPTPEITRERIALKQRSESDFRGEDPMIGEFVREFIAINKRMGSTEARPIYMEEEALERLNDWLMDTTEIAGKSRNPKNMKPTVQRLAINIWKCAALLAVHDRSDKIGLKHLLPVLWQAEEWYRALNMMSNAIAASEFERQVNDVEGFLIESGGTRKRSAVYRKFGARPMIVNEWIEALVQQGRVVAQGQDLVVRGEGD